MAQVGASQGRDWRAAVEDSVKRAELESFLFTGVEEAEGRFGKEVPGTFRDDDTDSNYSEDVGTLVQPELLSGDNEGKGGLGGKRERKAAWEDEDDAGLLIDANASRHGRKAKKQQDIKVLTGAEYSKRLRVQHEKLHPHTSWAKTKSKTQWSKRQRVEDSSSEDDERIDQGQGDAQDIIDDLLVSANPLLGQSKLLPRGQINISTMPEANRNARTFGFVNSVEFQSTGQLMLSCGKDKRLHLFHIDGVENPNVQSVHFEDMKIWKASFSQSDDQVIVSGTGKNYFYLFDVETGGLQRISSSQAEDSPKLSIFTVSPRNETQLVAFYGQKGNISLFSANSKQWIGQLKMNSGSTVESAAFSHDGQELYSAGSGGRIHLWDLRMRRCRHSFADEGALRCTSMSIDHGGKYLATGSEMGVVNLYNLQECHSDQKMQPKPLRALTNLTTTIDFLEFNPDSQILALGSQRIPSALRLAHLPSSTVFQNWPTQRIPLGNVSSAAFSPGGGFFAVGNSKGKVLLYRLHHYGNA